MSKTKLQIALRENTWSFGPHGWGNGYVILPKEHPCHGMDYDDIPVNVHGCLTYGEPLNRNNFPTIEANEDVFIVGFDTAHDCDNQANWTKEDVLLETENLRNQLEKIWK